VDGRVGASLPARPGYWRLHPDLFEIFLLPTLKFLFRRPLPVQETGKSVEINSNLFCMNPKVPVLAAVNEETGLRQRNNLCETARFNACSCKKLVA
jgi:hypothetical protein